jgi:hypothetical protein
MRLDVVWILGIIAAVLSKLLADECKAWMPCFTKWLIRHASALLPEDQRERYKEEWQSHIDETPGDIGKILAAMGFVWAAKRVPLETTNKCPRIINATCRIEVRAVARSTAVISPRLVRKFLTYAAEQAQDSGP